MNRRRIPIFAFVGVAKGELEIIRLDFSVNRRSGEQNCLVNERKLFFYHRPRVNALSSCGVLE